MSLAGALERISADRAAALTLELASIPSPTGDTLEVTERLADHLRSLGLEVTMFRELPQTPVVVGRLRGRKPGRTLILNGHLDTVPIPHAPPQLRDGRVYGRGTADMKGCICAAVETIRAVIEADLPLAGDVVLCAHGLHEAPGGHAEDLEAALRAGVVAGDAAIVLEIGADFLPVAGLGSGIYDAYFRRPGEVTHELMTDPEARHPVFAVAEAILAIRAFDERLRERMVEYAGRESIFIGQVHCGDFFNRFPNEASIQGTRRYGPDSNSVEAGAELKALLEPIAEKHGVELDFRFTRVRDGFRIAVDHPLVGALRSAFQDETGKELPISGIRIIADAPTFEKVGGIPCLYHGLAGEGAHGDVESLPISELQRAARVYLRTLVHYLGLTD